MGSIKASSKHCEPNKKSKLSSLKLKCKVDERKISHMSIHLTHPTLKPYISVQVGGSFFNPYMTKEPKMTNYLLLRPWM